MLKAAIVSIWVPYTKASSLAAEDDPRAFPNRSFLHAASQYLRFQNIMPFTTVATMHIYSHTNTIISLTLLKSPLS